MAKTASKAALRARLTPRKAPRQQRAEHTVASLIEGAAQVLESDGLEGFNTNKVALRAGVSVGSLYQYFPGKDALILALMEREDALFHDDGVAALERDDGLEALECFIDAAVKQQLARPRLARLLDIEESRPDLQRAMAAMPGSARSVRQLLERVLGHPDLPRQPSVPIAALDVGAIIRGLTDGAGARGETDRAALRERIVAAVFGYLEAMSRL